VDPLQCGKAFGEATVAVCQRAIGLGWSAPTGAGWLSTLAAVIAGFIFAAIVMALANQGGHEGGSRKPAPHVDALPVLIGAFLSLLVAALLLVLVSAQAHPLRVGPATTIATAVFAAGAVQTFVAIAWLFVVSPHTASAFGSVKLVVRFVMFFAGLNLYETVWKSQTTTTGDRWSTATMVASVALLAGPWLVARAVFRTGDLVTRFDGQLQVFTTRCAVGFLAVAAVGLVFVTDHDVSVPAHAFPGWMAASALLAVGLLFALFDLNLPPLVEAMPPAPVEAGQPVLVRA
jgi:hypothetical protein